MSRRDNFGSATLCDAEDNPCFAPGDAFVDEMNCLVVLTSSEGGRAESDSERERVCIPVGATAIGRGLGFSSK